MLTGRTTAPAPGLSFYDAWEMSGPPTPGYTWSNNNPWATQLLWPNRRIDYIFSATPRPGGAATPWTPPSWAPTRSTTPTPPTTTPCNPASATDHVSCRAWRLDEVQAIDDQSARRATRPHNCVLHAAARLIRGRHRRTLKSPPPGPGQRRSPPPGSASRPSLTPPDQHKPVPPTKEGIPGDRGTPGHPARQPGHRHTPGPNPRPETGQPERQWQPPAPCRVGGWRGGSLTVGPGAFMFRRFPGRLRHPSAPGQVCSVSSPRRFEPCMRFSRTRLTDAVHRRHSALPASPGRVWGQRRFLTRRSARAGSGTGR